MKKNDVMRLNDAIREITKAEASPLMAYVFLVINYDFDPKVFHDPHVEFLDVIEQSSPEGRASRMAIAGEVFEKVRTTNNTHCVIVVPSVFVDGEAVFVFKTIRDTLAELNGMVNETEHCFQFPDDIMYDDMNPLADEQYR